LESFNCLDNILAYFDLNTGEPYVNIAKGIKKWPVIDFTRFKSKPKQSLFQRFFNLFAKKIPFPNNIPFNIAKYGFKLTLNEVQKEFNFEQSTLSSLLVFLFDLISNFNDIDFEKFWLVHKYLDKNNGFQLKSLNLTETFFLDYRAHYREIDDNDNLERELKWNSVDRCLKRLCKFRDKNCIQGQNLIDLLSNIKIDHVYNKITSSKNLKELEDLIESLLDPNRNAEFHCFVNNLDIPRLRSNIVFDQRLVKLSHFKVIRDSLMNKKIVLIKGILKCGKTEMAKSFCSINKLEFTSCLVNFKTI